MAIVNTDRKSSVVVCTIPKAGLGNQLFPLMKAAVFAHLNDLPLMVTGYQAFKMGPYLRREKSKRKYSNYFNFEKHLVGAWLDHFKIRRLRRAMNLVEEPELKRLENSRNNIVYSFTARIRWDDFFNGLKEHRKLVLELFWDLLKGDLKQELIVLKPPVIGIHIRLGDFRKLGPSEDFRKVGGVRTPEKYFVDVVTAIRKAHGKDLPVSVFSDGHKHELPELFKLKNISLIEGNRDIVDMLLLSKSQIIVTSAGSTFSYWAGFMSDAPIIMHPDHIHKPIRSVTKDSPYEGPLDMESKLLRDSILGI